MKKYLNKILIVFLVLTLLMPQIGSAISQNQNEIPGLNKDIENLSFANEVIIKFKDVNKGKKALTKKGKKIKKSFKHIPAVVTQGISDQELQAFKNDPNVEYIEHNALIHTTEDILTTSLNQIYTPEVHDLGIYGNGVKVAVLDTGVDLESTELQVVDGVSFVPEEPSPDDQNGHGTFVSGIIAALKNSEGLVGIAPEVELYAAKVMNQHGVGSYSQVIEAMEWAIDTKIDIVSMSFTGTNYSHALEEIFQLAYSNDILLVAPTGNGGSEGVLYPAKFNSVIAVGAVDSENNLAIFSNTGDEVELVAPGVNIQGLSLTDTYDTKSGTSFAVPHVVGTLALMKHKYPKMNNEELREVIKTNTTPLAPIKNNLFGYGLVNAAQAITNENSVEASPEKVFSLLKNKQLFSELTKQEQDSIEDFFKVTKELLLMGEQKGHTLKDSIQIAIRVVEFELSYEEIESLLQEYKNMKKLDKQLLSYKKFIKRYQVEEIYLEDIKTLFLQGHQSHYVHAAYTVGAALNIPFASLIYEDHKKAEKNLRDKEQDFDPENYEVAERVLKQNPVQIETLQAYILNSDKSWSDIEKDIQLYVRSKETFTGRPTGKLTIETASQVEYDKYIQAPFNVKQNNNESIQAGTGHLGFEQTNYILPGRNGLDLVLDIRYDSSESNLYEADYYYSSYEDYDYEVTGGALAYYSNWIGTDRYSYGDIAESTIGTYETYDQAYSAADNWASQDYIEEDYWEDGTDLIMDYYAGIWQVYDPDDSYSSEYNSKRPTTYSELQTNIGSGWSFGFSSIETDHHGQRYLHLSNGSKYKIQFTSTVGDSNLEKYTLKDLRIETDNSSYQNAQNVSSAFALYYKNGTKEYFGSDGRLLAIKDRYGNKIKFEHQVINGRPVISKITDTLDRVTDFDYTTTTTGKKLTVTLPNAKTIKYISELVTGYNNDYVLKKIVDEKNRETIFDYDLTNCKANFNFFNKNNRYEENVFACLKTITYPTLATTQYTYEKAVANLGSQGSYEYYRIKTREDFADSISYEKNTYTYTNNFSGYPTYSNPRNLPTGFKYSMGITDLNNKVTTMTLNNKHLIDKLETKVGTNDINGIAYVYNADKLPSSVTTTQYNIGTTVKAAQTVEYTYDAWGDVLTYKDAFQNQITYTYDSTYHIKNSEISYSDASTMQKTEWVVNPTTGNIDQVKVRHFDNGMDRSLITNLTYDSYGNKITESIKKQDGTYANIFYEYDVAYKSGYLTRHYQTAQDVSGNSQLLESKYTYDFNTGMVNSFTDGEQNKYQYQYDELGRLRYMINPGGLTHKEIIYDDVNNIVTSINEMGYKQRNLYDGLGRLLKKQTFKDNTWITAEESHYNQLGLVDWIKDISGDKTSYTYDVLGRITQITNPDLTYKQMKYQDAWVFEGGTNRVQTIDEVGHSTYTFYDKEGQEKAIYVNDLGITVNLGSDTLVSYTAKYEYDGVGNMVNKTDAKGNVTLYQYDDLNRLRAVTNDLLETTRYEYNNMGQLTKVTYHDDDSQYKRYDDAGRLIEKTDESSEIEKFYYDRNGNLDIHMDRNGTTFDYLFDDRDRLKEIMATKVISESETAIQQKTFDYNAAGQRISATNEIGTFGYEYRLDNGALEKVTFPDLRYIEMAEEMTVSNSTLIDPFGQLSYNKYDNMNRLDYVALDSLIGTKEADYSYTSNGKLEQVAYPNGTQMEYQYDQTDANQLEKITHNNASGTPLNEYSYMYDKNFNINNVTSKVAATVKTLDITYDDLDRIATASEDNEVYIYDVRGNRLTLQSDKPMDLDGVEYHYNLWNQLIEVVKDDGTIITYTYGPDGLLYERQESNGPKVRYYYHNGHLVAEGNVIANGTSILKARYLRGLGIVNQMDANGNKYYYLTNGHGDIVEMRDSSGQIVNQYSYDLWGKPTIIIESVVNPFKYSGEFWDETSGLQYLRARWYDPSMGRFINEDTYEGDLNNPLTLNLYTYTANNPLKYHDPTGHFFDIIVDIGFALYDTYVLIKDPSWENASYLALDIGAAFVPFATGAGPLARTAAHADEVVDGLKYSDDAAVIGKSCNCFTAGTKVLTDEGEKNIEDIEVGDMVLSKNEETGEQAYKEVTHLYRNDKEIIYELTVGDQIIETTDNHPFWVEGKGWVLAADLQVGDQLQQSNGNTLTIDTIKIVKHDEMVRVYNFTVADFHTYFVSSLGVWVHNISCEEINWKGFSNGKLKPHWEKHKDEFGDISQNDYLKLAKGFSAETNASFKEQVVGNILVKFDPSSGRVLVGHIKDREIRTFYKDDGRSDDPFQAAIDLAKSLGGG